MFVGSALTISFGLASRDYSFNVKVFLSATFSKCWGFGAVVINRGVVCFFLGSQELLVDIIIITSTF